MDFSNFSGSNACAGIDPQDCAELERAAVKLLDARNIVIKISEGVGDATSSVGGKAVNFIKTQFDVDIMKKIEEIT